MRNWWKKPEALGLVAAGILHFLFSFVPCFDSSSQLPFPLFSIFSIYALGALLQIFNDMWWMLLYCTSYSQDSNESSSLKILISNVKPLRSFFSSSWDLSPPSRKGSGLLLLSSCQPGSCPRTIGNWLDLQEGKLVSKFNAFLCLQRIKEQRKL